MRKPRGMHPVKLPMLKPDRCADCPLIGIIPDGERLKGSKRTHVCLGTWVAIAQRSLQVKASAKDSHHPLRRPCDMRWESWQKLPERYYNITDEHFIKYRKPYEDTLKPVINFHWRANQ